MSTIFSKSSKLLPLLAVSTLTLTSCAAVGAGSDRTFDETDEGEIVLQAQSPYGPENFMSAMWADYADAVEDASEGRIVIEVAYSAALASVDEQEAAVRDGLLDIAWSMPSRNPSAFPLNALLGEIAFLVDTGPLVGMLQGHATTEIGFHDEIVAEVESQGLISLMSVVQQMPSHGLLCAGDPVTSLDDFAGKQIRVPGAGWADEIEALGGTPVDIAQSELYEALERGIVDCAVTVPGQSAGLGFFDVADHWVPAGLLGWNTTQIIMSKEKWESLPHEAQQILWDEAGQTLLASMITNSIDAVILESQEAQKKVEMHEFDDDVLESLAGHRDAVLEEAERRATELLGEGQTLIADYREVVDKWHEIVTEDLGYSDEDHPTFSEFSDAYANETVDIDPFIERFMEEVMDPNRP